MPNLVWRIDMKVKEITISEAEVTSRPIPNAMQIAVDGKPVAQANDPAIAQQITQAAKDGKLTINDPTKAPGTTGTGIQEEPGTGFVAPVNTKTNPPMVMDNGNTGGSPLGMTSSGEEITPQLVARSTDWQERSIQANGKTYPALYSGTKGYRVGKQTYQAIMGSSMSTPSANKVDPGQSAQARMPAKIDPGQSAQARMPTRESADDQLLQQMLSIAGLR